MSDTLMTVPGWPDYWYGPEERERGLLRVPVIRKSDHREMCEVVAPGWIGEDGLHRRASYALFTIVSEEGAAAWAASSESIEVGLSLQDHVAAAAYGARMRRDDPGWSDPGPMIAQLREQGMLDGAEPPKLRTAGWQVLTVLAALAQADVDGGRDGAS